MALEELAVLQERRREEQAQEAVEKVCIVEWGCVWVIHGTQSNVRVQCLHVSPSQSTGGGAAATDRGAQGRAAGAGAAESQDEGGGSHWYVVI